MKPLIRIGDNYLRIDIYDVERIITQVCPGAVWGSTRNQTVIMLHDGEEDIVLENCTAEDVYKALYG